MKQFFFDIPVYRLSEKKYYLEQDTNSRKIYKYFYLKSEIRIPTISHEQFLELPTSRPDMWRYNEIIGYIRLYILGHEIRGEYYQHKALKIYKTRKKHFIYKTHKLAAEISILHQNDMQIYELVLKYLQKCELELKKRYIDIEHFKEIGQYVQWNLMIQTYRDRLNTQHDELN